VFFGGPEAAGGIKGLQAENLVPVSDDITDDQAPLVSDILLTGLLGANLAKVERGDRVRVFGCCPVGQMAITSAVLVGGRGIAVDRLPDRLEMTPPPRCQSRQLRRAGRTRRGAQAH
jgi:threonine dehydrogenase-like Zn-dependent dehydrogenase